MKVVLLQDIKNLGQRGDIKEISEGYARNFVLPKKLAVMATDEAIQKAETEKAQKIRQEKENLNKNRKLAKDLNGLEISLEMQEKNGKLFGSIAAKNIATELKNRNFDIPEKCIKLGEMIKKIGEYKIRIDLGNQISSEIILRVTPRK